MDPVGPWSAYAAASYNRLANATAVTAAAAGDYHHQLATVGVAPGGSHSVSASGTTTTTTPHQLLLQAAHVSGAVNAPSAFNPGRFLASPHVSYDSVFSPLFHQKAHYNSSLNQRHSTLKQGQTEGNESNIVAAADLVGQYSAVHHQTLAAAAGALFEHQTNASASPYQPTAAHAQLHSPFGVLPHESVLGNGSGATSKITGGTIPYENTYASHFSSEGSSSQTENHVQNPGNSTIREFCQQENLTKKQNKSQVQSGKNNVTVPQTLPSSTIVKSVAGGLYSSSLMQQQQCCQNQLRNTTTTITMSSNSNNNNNSFSINNNYETINKSCLQLNNNSALDGNKKQLNTIMDRRQVAPADLHQRDKCGSGQSSPVCFTMASAPVDQSANLISNYNNNGSSSGTNASSVQSRCLPRNNVITIAQYQSPLRPVVSPVSYSAHSTLPVKTPPSDVMDLPMSTAQKSPDCGVVIPRRPSPLMPHSRSSPLAHVPSPVYPVYNSPVTSINNSPTQQIAHVSSMPVQCQQQSYTSKHPSVVVEGQPGGQLPLDVTIQRRPTHDSSSNKTYSGQGSECSTMVSRSWDTSQNDERVAGSGNSNNINSTNRHKTNSRSNVINPPGYGIGSVVQKLHEQQLQQQQLQQQQQQQQLYFNYRTAVDRSIGIPERNSDDKRRLPDTCASVTANVSSPPPTTSSSTPSTTNTPSPVKLSRKHTERAIVNRDVPTSAMSRVPPPAHNNSVNQPQFDNYFDYERWNLSGSVKVLNRNPSTFPEQSAMELSRNDGICNSNVNSIGGNSGIIITCCNNNNSNSSNSSSSCPTNTTSLNSHQNDANQPLNLPSTFYHHSHISSPLAAAGSLYSPHCHPHHRLASEIHLSLTTPVPHVNTQCRSENSVQNVSQECLSDTSSQNKVDENPKVVVPNIEEELDFLKDDNPPTKVIAKVQDKKIPEKKTPIPVVPERKPLSVTNPNNGGFMASYLKFLQGERDPSPPPTGRTVRKMPYTKPKMITNDVQISSKPSTSTAPTYNLEDDPRYFPLPKTSAHRGSLDSSDDDNDNDHGEFSCFKKLKPEKEKETPPAQSSSSAEKSTVKPETDSKPNNNCKDVNKVNLSVLLNDSAKKVNRKDDSKRNKVSKKNNSIKKEKKLSEKNEILAKSEKKKIKKLAKVADKKSKQKAPSKKEPNKKQKVSKSKRVRTKPIEPDTPQRTVPKRKAKENILEKSRQKLLSDDEFDDFLDNDIEDVDFEPDWLPNDDDDDYVGRYGAKGSKRKRGKGPATRSSSSANNRRSTMKSRKRNKKSTVEVEPDTTTVITEEGDEKSQTKAVLSESNKSKAKAINGYIENDSGSNVNVDFRCPFSVGEFVVSKDDLIEEWPPIWRVNGKSLLHKYMPFEQNGETLYKCVPTYSNCTSQNVSSFKTVPVRIRQRSKTKTDAIVELLRSEMVLSPDEQAIVDAAMKETAKYQDNFEVYIQTLLSQALDSNFLAEIIQEKDEYFLINMKAIDDLTEEHRLRMVKSLSWDNRILERSLYTWPCFNITYSATGSSDMEKECESCDSQETLNRVVVYGQPYCGESLEGRLPDRNVIGHKEMLVCRSCLSSVVLYNKICHQKYLMFIECGKRVAEKRSTSPDKDTTVILNELLADEAWLQHIFNKVRLTWAQVNRLEKSKEQKTGKT